METIIVAGLGRCGSSLVMQMLAASGFNMTGNYPAFEDARINQRSTKSLFFGEWKGKAVKVIDPHRYDLATDGCRIVWLSRNEKEQAKSISKFGNMMLGLPEYNRAELRKLEKCLKRDRLKCLQMFKRSGVPFVEISFERLVEKRGEEAYKIARFVGGNVVLMSKVIRDRTAKCYPGLLELELLQAGS